MQMHAAGVYSHTMQIILPGRKMTVNIWFYLHDSLQSNLYSNSELMSLSPQLRGPFQEGRPPSCLNNFAK